MMKAGDAGKEKNRDKFLVIAVSLLTVLIAFLLLWSNYEALRKERFAWSEKRAEQALLSFEKYSIGLFDYSDTYLRSIRHLYLEYGSVDRLREHLSDVKAPHSESFSNLLGITDADGNALFRSDAPGVPKVNLADRDYFTRLRNQAEDDLVIDATRRGRITGRMQYRFVRPILRDGRFDGVILLTLVPEHISEFYRDMALGPHSEAMMLSPGLRLIARHPAPAPGDYDRVIPGLKMWGDLDTHPSGRVRMASPFDGVTRTYFYKRLADYPVVIVMGISDEDVLSGLAEARAHMMWLAATFMLSGIVICLLVLRLLGHLDERKAAEETMRRLSRLLHMQSEGNQAVVRAGDETELFSKTCDIVVGCGGFRIAWIGMAEQDKERSVRPVAVAGPEAAFVENVKVSWGEASRSQGISGRAIRQGGPEICRDFRRDPQLAQWRDLAEKYGLRSGIALPLKDDAEILGALTIYSADPDAFGPEEAKLLVELAEDVSYGITALRTRRRHQEVEHALFQVQKMECLGHLTGGIAHDFNNLLQVILSNLDLSLRSLSGGHAAAYLQNAVGGAQQGARLTSQLLAFARRQPLCPEPLRIDRLVGEMTSMLRRTIGEHIDIEMVSSGGLWTALVDRNQLQNAILNLAINARDAMPGGGRLTIELDNALLDAAYVAAHRDVKAGYYVALAVTDTGVGMSPEVLDQAFEPFFTTKPEGAGTGLGLSMVYGFVKQSGGHVKIYSEIGHGTTIRLYLPRTEESEVEQEAEAERMPHGEDEIVLVAEDDDAVRASVVAQLTDLGYTVLEARNGEAALAVLAAGERVDLLFTDVVMRGAINGRLLAERVRQLLPDLPILFTSGYPENAILRNGRLEEGVVLLSKPYRQARLAEAIHEMLHPREAAPGGAPAEPVPAAGEDALGRMLLVEDEPLVRDVMTETLECLGCQVVAVARPSEALRLLESDPQIGTLISDFSLPEMNGVSLARQALAGRPDLAVVIATGQVVEAKDLPDPSVVVLLKPFQPQSLYAAIQKAQAAKAAQEAEAQG